MRVAEIAGATAVEIVVAAADVPAEEEAADGIVVVAMGVVEVVEVGMAATEVAAEIAANLLKFLR